MNCSWCDKEISKIGAFKDSRYCCAEHRKLEREHLRKLAIERLREAGAAIAKSQPDPSLTPSVPPAENPALRKHPAKAEIQSNGHSVELPEETTDFILYSAKRVS